MRSSLGVTLRTAFAVGGGYLAASSAFGSFCTLSVVAGMRRSEAVALGTMLVFVLYLTLILWVFAVGALWRPCFVFMLIIAVGYITAFYSGSVN